MAYDTQNFDETFLDMEPVLDEYNDDAMDTDQEPGTDAERTDGDESNTTPSQSRSSSVRPLARSTPAAQDEESVDVFDGYSFKGRHSIIMDDDVEEDGSGDDGSFEEESAEDDTTSSVMTGDLRSETATIDEAGDEAEDESIEPKTPEARPAALPPTEVVAEAPAPTAAPVLARSPTPPLSTPVAEVKPEPSKLAAAPAPAHTREETEAAEEEELAQKIAIAAAALEVEEQQTKIPDIARNAQTKTRPPLGGRAAHKRREKSGIPALDKDLSDANDDETCMTEPERDEEDDDWDFVEAGDGEDKNGTKTTSLWARGVVDRYKLSVFRKPSTPSNGRSVSGMSKVSQVSEATESPSPSQRRGRNGGINFRKNPRQFLRPKSPPSTFATSPAARSFSQTANSLSAASTTSPSSLLTPIMSPSLKSKESAVSMGGQSVSSDQSGNVVSPSTPSAANGAPEDSVKNSSPPRDQDKPKSKKLKKYKHNAEKVFSLFTPSSKPQVSQS